MNRSPLGITCQIPENTEVWFAKRQAEINTSLFHVELFYNVGIMSNVSFKGIQYFVHRNSIFPQHCNNVWYMCHVNNRKGKFLSYLLHNRSTKNKLHDKMSTKTMENKQDKITSSIKDKGCDQADVESSNVFVDSC